MIESQENALSATPSRPEFRSDIEGLRGIAVLAVVLVHIHAPGMDGGYVGVDIFYVLSGFLITTLILRELEQSGTLSLTAFWARRARRLLPASLLVLLATVAASWLLAQPLYAWRTSTDAAWVAFYAGNIQFALNATDYLKVQQASSPLQHYWSLGLEEQFYVVWPLLALLAMRVGRWRGWKPRATLLVGALGIFVLSFGWCVYLTTVDQPWAFFSLPTRAWELSLGAVITLSAPYMSRMSTRLASVLSGGGLVMLALVCALYSRETVFPGSAALLPVLGTAAVLAAGVSSDRTLFARALSIAPLRWLGRYSYSIYLWHWPVLTLGALALGDLSILSRLGLVALVVVLSVLTCQLVEDPVRYSAALAKRPRLALSLAAGATLSGAALVLLPQLWVLANASTQNKNLIAASIAAWDKPDYGTNCHATIYAVEAGDCVAGDPSSGRTWYLVGDSHAHVLVPAFDQAAREQGVRLVGLSKTMCPMVDAPPWDVNHERPYPECVEWRKRVLDRIQTDASAERVYIANSKALLAKVANGRGGVLNVEAGSTVWEKGLETVVKSLRLSGIEVVLLRDVPRPDFDVPVCVSGLTESIGCTFDLEAQDARAWKISIQVARRNPGSRALDLTPVVCPEGRVCPTFKDGIIRYRDASHLTGTYSAHLGPALSALLLREQDLSAHRDPS